MSQPPRTSYQRALRDFQHARQQAVMQQLLAHFSGDDADLHPFDEIKEQLHPTGETIEHGTQEIPLDKIVGSVARYKDFTRSFLPKRESDQERWAGVRAAVTDMVGIPPIEVYQIGDAYFVKDGNHRVSIARRLNSKTITAYVTEVKTRVPFSADDDPNEIICKANYADFLEQTNLDKLRPDVDITMTFCGHYQVFIEQILSGSNIKQGDPVDQAEWDKAVLSWYDQIYLPIIHIIRDLGVLYRFPERTEADMYLILSERREELEQDLGWNVEMETGVSDLIVDPEEPQSLIKRVTQSIAPKKAGGSWYGLWRRQQIARKRYHHLFKDILVPLDGTEANWRVFENYLKHNFDEDRFLGLHVVPDESAVNSYRVRQMRDKFLDEIESAGMKGEFAVEIGSKPIQVINKRAAWVDLVLVHGTRKPDFQPLNRTGPELKLLVEQCPRPIQVMPDGTQSDYSRYILAYDGSHKSDEALFIATYIVARWKKSLTVVTVETDYTTPAALQRAKQYLTKHGVTNANYILRKGPIADMVLDTAKANNCNVLLMGGFSFRSLRQLSLGSSAQQILREFPDPMWICR